MKIHVGIVLALRLDAVTPFATPSRLGETRQRQLLVWSTLERESVSDESPAFADETGRAETPSRSGAALAADPEPEQKSDDDRPPGERENDIFECDPSVWRWRGFQIDGLHAASENLAQMTSIASRFVRKGPKAASYWARHAGRTSYFVANAALGTVASNLHSSLTGTDPSSPVSNLNSDIATRLLLEAFLSYEQDYARIEDGEYSEPWDMKLGHRQSSPINVATQTSRFVREAIGTLARRGRQTEEDKNIWITDKASPDLYPEYYQTAFHYQTDGWMSKRSADVYETSTETLFVGRQDCMQRTALRPLVELSRRRDPKLGPLRVLEVACGTGRFMTFMRDNLPLDTAFTAIDLSPYYLDAARENDEYWRKFRREEGADGDIKPLRCVQSKAEELPFEDGSFDAVVCVYLYHELPRDVRAQVSSEMARVLRKDGILVLADSIQKGDRPVLDSAIGNFGNMNEPYYVDYINDDLPRHFVSGGLVPKTKTVCSTTKSLTFHKE